MPDTMVTGSWISFLLHESSAGMAVLIWLVQLVIYPGFRPIETTAFPAWHRSYTGRISWIVIPLMLVQAGALGWLLATETATAARVGAAVAVGIAWVTTFAVSVPIHERLDAAKDLALIERLIATNWIRTVAWTMVPVVLTT